MDFQARRRFNLDLLTTLKGAVSLIKDPAATESVFDIEDGMRGIKATQLLVEYLKSKPEVSQMIEERYIAPKPDLEALGKYPVGSLGYAFASYIQEHGFDADYYRKVKVQDDISYIFLRIRQTHDIWHIVTGISTDEIGELSLKAFELAQTRRPMAAVIVTGGILRTLFKEPQELDNLLNQIAIGYRMGAKAKPFLAQKWEENWHKPLSEWRLELGIEPTSTYIPL